MNVLPLLTDPDAWAALVMLTALEIVLGIDNLVFISVLTAQLEADKARRARQVGLSLAFIFRVIMLAGLTWLMGLTENVGARLPCADRRRIGRRRLRVPYSARIYLFRHGICRRGRGVQRHGKAQPAASAADLTA
jgi:hypothetical protein